MNISLRIEGESYILDRTYRAGARLSTPDQSSWPVEGSLEQDAWGFGLLNLVAGRVQCSLTELPDIVRDDGPLQLEFPDKEYYASFAPPPPSLSDSGVIAEL